MSLSKKRREKAARGGELMDSTGTAKSSSCLSFLLSDRSKISLPKGSKVSLRLSGSVQIPSRQASPRYGTISLTFGPCSISQYVKEHCSGIQLPRRIFLSSAIDAAPSDPSLLDWWIEELRYSVGQTRRSTISADSSGSIKTKQTELRGKTSASARAGAI